jgi:nucleoside-diphosphate-sugar epimerase
MLGRRLLPALKRTYPQAQIHALDLRLPLLSTVDSNHHAVHWHKCDISDDRDMNRLSLPLHRAATDLVVVHLAAFWSLDLGHKDMYERVNVRGTRNVLNWCARNRTRHVIFASSLTARQPSLPGNQQACQLITEGAACDAHPSVPYGISKLRGEDLLDQFGQKYPEAMCDSVLFAGLYDPVHCLLPPLAWLFDRWSMPAPLGCIIPGRGQTRVPYMDINDAVDMIMALIHQRPRTMTHTSSSGPRLFSNTFIGAPRIAPSHLDLFQILRPLLLKHEGTKMMMKSICVPVPIIRAGLWTENVLRRGLGMNQAPEPPNALKMLDHSWAVDPSLTYQLLKWEPTRVLQNALPGMVSARAESPIAWRTMQSLRAQQPRLVYQALRVQMIKNKNRPFPLSSMNHKKGPRALMITCLWVFLFSVCFFVQLACIGDVKTLCGPKRRYFNHTRTHKHTQRTLELRRKRVNKKKRTRPTRLYLH